MCLLNTWLHPKNIKWSKKIVTAVTWIKNVVTEKKRFSNWYTFVWKKNKPLFFFTFYSLLKKDEKICHYLLRTNVKSNAHHFYQVILFHYFSQNQWTNYLLMAFLCLLNTYFIIKPQKYSWTSCWLFVMWRPL